MKKLMRFSFLVAFTMLLSYACDDPPEVLKKDLTVADVRSVYDVLSSGSAPASGRQDSIGIDWDHGQYKDISIGDALVFPLQKQTTAWVLLE